MSLESRYDTEIVVPRAQRRTRSGRFLDTPCGRLLRNAVEKVARDHGGDLAERFVDADGNEHPVPLSLTTEEFPSGIWVEVTSDGRVQFHYDRACPGASHVERICNEITQTYAVLAVLRAQEAAGFQPTAREEPEGDTRKRVIVEGVA